MLHKETVTAGPLDLTDWPNLVLEKDLTLKEIEKNLLFHRDKFVRES